MTADEIAKTHHALPKSGLTEADGAGVPALSLSSAKHPLNLVPRLMHGVVTGFARITSGTSMNGGHSR
jgi:hypothetical protein